MHVDRTRYGPRTHQAGERLDLPEVVDDGRQASRDDLLVGAAVVPAHHEDRRDDAGLAQLDALLEQGDAEPVDLGSLERARNGGRAVPVRVRLEHGPDTGLARVPLEHAQIVPERLEVDLRARGTHGVGRSGAAGSQDAGHERLSHDGGPGISTCRLHVNRTRRREGRFRPS